MWACSKWGCAAVLVWPTAVWAQQPAPRAPAQSEEPTVNVGTAALPDIDERSTEPPSDLRSPEPPVPTPEPVTRLLGPTDNPYRGPSIPGSAAYDNPYRGPSLKPPYDNPYRGPSAPAESLPQSAPRPAHWGPPETCPPGTPCPGVVAPGTDQASTMAPTTARPSAVQGSPFINATAGAFLLRDRVHSPLAFGGDLGAFVLDRARLSARALVPIANPSDEMPGQAEDESRSIWLWGFAAGLVLAESASFTLSPGLQYLRVAGGPHGNAVGVQVPFEWLFDSGLRFGFDFSVLYGFGGSYRVATCAGSFDGGCVENSKARPGAPGVALNLVLGQAFTSPKASRSP